MAVIAYRAARIVDGASDDVLEDGAILVEGGRIVAVQSARSVSPSVEVTDLGEVTILPGLVDAHVHLVWTGWADPDDILRRESRYLTVLRCAANCMAHLRAGVTTVRDVGSTDGMAVDVSRAVQQGIIPGPRVVAAGRAIAMTGGHALLVAREADGPDAVRAAARAEIKAGAHFIKLMASGGVYGHGEEIGSTQLNVDELRAGVEEAHKTGRKATAHAYSVAAMSNCLDAGVDCVEHGSFMDPPTAGRMREAGTYLVPTLSTYQAMHDRGPSIGSPDYVVRKTKEVLEASRTAYRLATEMGVNVAAGTDGGGPGHPHGALPEELRIMVALGATPMQAIQCGTSSSAKLLGLGGEIGTLEPGKRADLLVVAGDPLKDITALKNVRLVVRDGAVAWQP